MIHGIGIDIVEVSRFKRAMERWGERFCSRLFTPSELAYCRAQRFPERHLSARFAGKVSFFKALGRPMRYRDVEITRGPSGAPVLNAPGLEGFKVSLSIAHDGALSVAEAFVERSE